MKKLLPWLLLALALVGLGAAGCLAEFLELKWWVGLLIGCMLLLGVGLLMSKRQNWTVQTLSYAALCIAIGFLLSMIRLFRMPQGGSVVLCSVLPLVAFSLYAGVWKGLAVCTAYGALQLVQGFYAAHWASLLMDYIIAYAVLALGGLIAHARVPEKWRLPAALILSGVLRYAVHVVSGVIFFGSYAEELGQTALGYSAAYNLFVFPEVAMCVVLALLPGFTRIFEPLKKLREPLQ